MPYKEITELPDGVQHVLPTHAQEIYKEAFNSAYDQYVEGATRPDGSSHEEVAHRVAWSAVKRGGYEKGDDDLWHKN